MYHHFRAYSAAHVGAKKIAAGVQLPETDVSIIDPAVATAWLSQKTRKKRNKVAAKNIPEVCQR